MKLRARQPLAAVKVKICSLKIMKNKPHRLGMLLFENLVHFKIRTNERTTGTTISGSGIGRAFRSFFRSWRAECEQGRDEGDIAAHSDWHHRDGAGYAFAGAKSGACAGAIGRRAS